MGQHPRQESVSPVHPMLGYPERRAHNSALFFSAVFFLWCAFFFFINLEGPLFESPQSALLFFFTTFFDSKARISGIFPYFCSSPLSAPLFSSFESALFFLSFLKGACFANSFRPHFFLRPPFWVTYMRRHARPQLVNVPPLVAHIGQLGRKTV